MRTEFQSIYRSSTALLSLLVIAAAVLVYYRFDLVVDYFTAAGFPGYLIRPISLFNVLAILAIWWTKHQVVQEWSYAVLSFELLLAIYILWGQWDYPLYVVIAAFVLLLISYFSRKKMRKRKRRAYH